MIVEVTIDSIRVSLMSQLRLVVLKDGATDRYLTIFIGQYEADAIAIKLRGEPVQRPLTHDLLLTTIESLGGELQHIVVSDLRDDIFYAQLVVDLDGHQIEIDSRPSDAIALAVRAEVPIYVDETVMDRAASTPDEEIDLEEVIAEEPSAAGGEDELSIFKDFVDTLNLDDLDE